MHEKQFLVKMEEISRDEQSMRNPNSASSSDDVNLTGSPGFCPSSFADNARVAATLGLCCAFLLDSTSTFGLIVAYFFESLDFRTGAAFFKVWGPLIAALIPLFLRSSFKSFAFAALCTQTNFLIGVWASRTQIENPLILLPLKRLLYTFVPFAASSIFTWATISAAAGMFNVSYYLMAFNCVFYWLFAIPKQVQDHGGRVPDENLIPSPLESCFLTLNLLFFPLLFHIASHYSALLSSLAAISDLLPFLIPFSFFLYACSRGALWWVTRIFLHLTDFDELVQLPDFYICNGTLAVLGIFGGLDSGGALHTFWIYIQGTLPLKYPLATTVILVGTTGAVASHGTVSDAFWFLANPTLAAVASAAGAIVVGLPKLFILLLSVAGFSLALFSSKKSGPSYFPFALLGSLIIKWFVMHNYRDPYIWLAGMFSQAIFVLVSAVPGSAILPGKLHYLAEAALIIHALLLCLIENLIFNDSGVYFNGISDDTMYLSYMVTLRILVGLVLVRRLSVDQRITPETSWILTCLYLSKLTVLFITSESVVWVPAVLLLAISPPSLLYRDRSRAASNMKSWQGYTHAVVVALAVWYGHETVFEVLRWWHGRPPSDGLHLCLCIVFIGFACISIVALHYPHVLPAKPFWYLVVASVLFISYVVALTPAACGSLVHPRICIDSSLLPT